MLNDASIAEKIGYLKRCGYWEVDSKYFFDKSECLRHATKVKKYDVKYHFYDTTFKSLNWSVEPKQSLTEMYKIRAEQLRDKYDYLILCFSGGADSTNILKTFIDNHIKLDEVYCEYPIGPLEKIKHKFSGNRNDPTLLTFEWYTAAEPALKKLAISNPEIKITVDDVTQTTIKLVENGDVYKLFRAGSSVNPNTTKYYRLYEIARQREKHGKVGCITGLDKPRIAFEPSKGKFYSTYSDFNNIFAEFPDDAFSGYQASMEFFYYAHEYPELNQKQCFAVKAAILDILKNKKDYGLYKKLLQAVLPSGVHVIDIHHDFFKKVLYEFWDTNTWQATKSPNFFYPPASQWFYDKELNQARTQDFFDKQLLELIHGIDKRFIIYDDGKPASFSHYMTRPIEF